MFLRLRNHFLLVILLCVQLSVWAQPVADFSIVAPVSNCNPAVYSFEDNSTGSNLAYEWNFGVYPGVNSIFPDPSTTYLNCGAFQVRLIVTDGSGLRDTSIQSVNVRCSPSANFASAASTGCIPHTAAFTSTSLPGSGNIANYVWDFGDGNSGIGENPSHTYIVPGCKNITLIVTNSFGCINDTTIKSFICIHSPVVAGFTSEREPACAPPFDINYIADTIGAQPLTYQWIFQGGVPDSSSAAMPSIRYNNVGNFGTTLITTDANGCTDTLDDAHYMSIDSSQVDFTIEGVQRCAPVDLPVTGFASGTPSVWSWTVSSGGVIADANAANTSIAFADSGTYSICLTVNYPDGCTAQKCSTVAMKQAPVANFGVSGPTATCVVPSAISFLDSSSGSNLSYSWLFPGGSPAVDSGAAPVISYDTCGTYSVSLIVNDDAGCSSTATKTDFLTITCPQTSYTVTPSDGCLPLTAFFTSDSTADAVSWLWDFDDPNSGADNTSTLQNPHHVFYTEGCYTVKLTTTNAEGCSSTYEIEAGVCAGWRPHANFSANPPLSCIGEPIQFSDSSTGTYEYTEYFWGFHPNADSVIESYLQNPNYLYWDTGVFDIMLIVANYGCADTITKDDYVKILPPIANPRAIYDCNDPLAVMLDGSSSTGADTYEWIILGGGSPANAITPVVSVTYPAPGDYNVALNVENHASGCTDLQNIVVHIGGARAEFTATPLSGCAPLQSCFNNLSANAISHVWTVTDSSGVVVVQDTAALSPCFTFPHAGRYSVQLIVTDSTGCIDTLYKPDYIAVSSLSADFISPAWVCAPATVSFQDASVAAGAGIAHWRWNFGDQPSGINNVSNLQNPMHWFSRGANFRVSLRVTDSLGCEANVVKRILLIQPDAGFEGTVTVSCEGTRACYTPDISVPDIGHLWDFGDGTTSNVATCHLYQNPGSYNLSLIATDIGTGCIDTSSVVVHNFSEGLDASFEADTTTSTCPPLVVSFSNFSSGADSATRWHWDFGDGQVSSLQSPIHIYTAVGKYTVTLIATTPAGCSDTLTYPDYIDITGPTASVATPPVSGCVPHQTCMSAISETATTYTWNLGDGMVTSAGDSICYTYTRTGTFYPELILRNGSNCVFSLPMGRVDVTGMVAQFSADSMGLCQQGEVHFIDSSHGTSAVTNWHWDFDDPASGSQNTSTLQNPAHFFSAPGVYEVIQTITSANGCVDSAMGLITVHGLTQPIIIVDDSVPCARDSVFFTGSTNASIGVASQVWNFGDPQSGAANTSALHNPAHYYASPGTYSISYTITDSNGCSNSTARAVEVLPVPVAAFTTHDTCLNTQPVAFNNTSQGPAVFLWTFAGVDTSAQQNPVHSFQSAGTYSVQLIAQNNSCSDTATASVEIFPLPDAAFSLPVHASCGPPAEFLITNSSTNAVSYTWDFGNNTFSTVETPVARYATAGAFTIELIAINEHGCADTAALPVTVHPNPDIREIDIETAEGCLPLSVQFDADVTDGREFIWNFGTDSAVVNTTSPSVSFTYADTGAYTVSLYVNSVQQCKDTLVLANTIKVFGYPVAAFDTFATRTTVYPYDGTMVFTNRSLNAVSYEWEFGDGTFSTEENPTHRYEYIDSYEVLLTATNEHGCSDTAAQRLRVFQKALYVPNALNPNNQGADELVRVWKPAGVGLLSYKAQVFDQWGTLLWQSEKLQNSEPAEAWDGTYNGKPCPQDVYVWKIQAVFLDGDQWPGMSYAPDAGGGTKTIGSITLVR